MNDPEYAPPQPRLGIDRIMASSEKTRIHASTGKFVSLDETVGTALGKTQKGEAQREAV